MAATISAAGPVILSLRLIGIPMPRQLKDLTQTVADYAQRGVALSLDLRQIDPTSGTTHAVRRLATFLGELGHRPRGGLRRVAVVASEQKTPAAIARMLQSLIDAADVESHCFRDEILAAQWLAASPGTAYEPPPKRGFTSPSGRQWTVEEYELPRSVGVKTSKATIRAHAVLRFSCGDVTLDLHEYPSGWERLGDQELIDLLRRASLPSFAPLALVL